MKAKISQKIVLLLFTLTWVGCALTKPDSYLVIMVPHLGISQVSCNSDDGIHDLISGISILCQESIRFTHTYTTSTLAGPSSASILTGLYPFQHQLNTNKGFLDPKQTTIAELALKNGFATSLISGGLPIVRKTGLHQGFEFFDDNFILNKNNLFRNFQQNIQIFKDWQNKETQQKPFLSVIFAPDLQFTNTQTTSTMGEARNLTFESQLEEFDYQLLQLIHFLKQEKIWQQTHILLIGMSGNQINRTDESIKPLNLNSENTQVAFLWKPASSKKRDLEQNWKIDANISLADIGSTLKKLINKANNTGLDKQLEDSPFPIVSLVKNLKETQVKFNQERPILIESAWSVQNNLGLTRYAVVSGKYLYINDSVPQLYNTLLDRLELYPLNTINQNNSQLLKIKNSLAMIGASPWPPIDNLNYDMNSIPFEYWTRKDLAPKLVDSLTQLNKKYPKNKLILNWLLLNTIENKKWQQLLQVAKNYNLPFANALAEGNIQRTVNIHLQNDCFQLLYFKKISHEDLKACNDPKMIDFIRYYRALELGLSQEVEKNKFKRIWQNHLNELDIMKINIGLSLLWDLNPRIEYTPETIDYVLSMPQFMTHLINN